MSIEAQTHRPETSGSRLANRVIAVTGGARGIGAAVAERLATEGASVAIIDLDIAGAAQVTERIRNAGRSAHAFDADVGDFGQFEAAVNETIECFGTLDGIVNNAAITKPEPLLEADLNYLDRIVRTNQYGCYHGMVLVGRRLRELGKGGVIINITSGNAMVGSPLMTAYMGTKGAILSMTLAAAIELTPLGIRCVAVAPGVVQTPRLEEFLAASNDAELLREHVAAQHLRNRFLAAEEIASVVAFLLSDDAVGVNATVVRVDDGWTQTKV